MKARVLRHEGALAVEIPEEVAAATKLDAGEVELEVRGSEVVISRASHELTLDEMLDRITPENRHELEDFGPPVGNEIW